MNVSRIDNCVNCGCCTNICPVSAVTVNEQNTFYSISVDSETCIDCGLCLKYCPLVQSNDKTNVLSAYAGWSRNNDSVMNSSSGGAFKEFAQRIIDEGGVVFGAAFSSDNKSVRFCNNNEIGLEKLQKSKYVESLVGNSFKKIRDLLHSGKKVLFCGTPCQVAGLNSFIGDENDSLITCDFACGGLPSHRIFQKYIESLEKKYHSEVISVDFRPKTYGWKRYAVLIRFANGKAYDRLGTEDDYLRSFLYGKYTVRNSCIDCKFSESHMSDLTIADFWLHEKILDLKNDNGISLVLCNTEKGERFFETVRSQFVCSELDVDKATYNNKKSIIAENTYQIHDEFLEQCEKKGLSVACREFIPRTQSDALKSLIIRYIFRRNDKE